MQSKMDTNDISTNIINAQNIPINNVPHTSNTINNRPKQVTYDRAELVATTMQLFNSNYSIDNNKQAITQEIKNYLYNIREFYNSNDTDILQRLIQLVHNTINNNWQLRTNVLSNIAKLQNQKIITPYQCEDLLVFNLFLNIMTNIKNSDKKAWTHKSVYQWNMMPIPVIIDGKMWFVDSLHVEGDHYNNLLAEETKYILKYFTKLLINKYFVLNNPNTWISKNILESKIEDTIYNICNCFDNLPITQQLLEDKHTTTYDNIPTYMSYSDIVNKYFDEQNVQSKLVKELTKVFKKSKIDKLRILDKSNCDNNKYENNNENEENNLLAQIKSKHIHDNIYKYIENGETFKVTLAAYKKFPEGLFDDQNGIPAIVLSYLQNKLENGQTWIVPEIIFSYMKKYNIIIEPPSDSEDKSNKDNDDSWERD